MQQWSKEYIELYHKRHRFSQLKYVQQSYILYRTGIYIMHPLGFEICRQTVIENGLVGTDMLSIQDVIINDHNWVKYIPKSFPITALDAMWLRMSDAACKNRLFDIYGGY